MNLSAFAQDAWTPSRRLTLTYGLRYDVNPAPTEKNGNLPRTVANLDPSNAANAVLAPAGTPLYATTYGNVAPRLGLSYRLSDRREAVVRGGFAAIAQAKTEAQ